MTAATSHLSLDSSGHPDPDTISEYVEDLLAPQASAELSAHLTGCADCRETHDSLEEIRSLLGELGETEVPPIPDDIALRIDAALAEAAQTATEAVDGGAGPTAARTAAQAATGPSSPSYRTSPSRPGAGGPGRRPRRRLRRAALGAAALAACGLIVTAALNLHPEVGSGSSSAANGAAAAGEAHASMAGASTAFSRSGFTQQIQRLLGAQTSGSARPQAQSGAKEPNSVPGATAVPSCVLAAVPRQTRPLLAATTGSYRSTAVYALVYPDPDDPAHKAEAYLVSADCLTPAEYTSPVLLSGIVPRP